MMIDGLTFENSLVKLIYIKLKSYRLTLPAIQLHQLHSVCFERSILFLTFNYLWILERCLTLVSFY